MTPPALVSIHNARDATWKWQDKMGVDHKRYYWVADRHNTSTAKRWYMAGVWWGYAQLSYQRYQKHLQSAPSVSSGVPSWFYNAMSCIADHEEYGYDGGSTVAGYFGFIYPPGSYGPVDQALVGTYGSSWTTWPLGAQLQVAYMLYGMYGWQPWSTAPGCGLT